MSQNSKSSSTLTADEIAGLSSLLCGISESQLMNIPVATISTTVKDIGTLTCLDQTQLDMFYAMVMMGYPSGVPDGALLQEMRVIAAGMTVPALQSLPLDVMSFISPAVYDAISPSRVKDGLSTLQLSASGITNIATILRNPRLFNDLTADQQDTLKLAAYGIDAVLDGSANSTGFDIDIFTGDDGGSNIIFEDNMNETTTAGSKRMIPFKYLSVLFALLAVVMPHQPFL
uniref:Uncharacterized protein n=1 Tax=Ciona savignyi TaxID=51511 RepID=H2ZQC1_CIOSA